MMNHIYSYHYDLQQKPPLSLFETETRHSELRKKFVNISSETETTWMVLYDSCGKFLFVSESWDGKTFF